METTALPREVNPAAHASLAVYEPAPVVRDEHTEDALTRLIEQQAAKIPSAWFLLASFAAMLAAAAFEARGKTRWSNFVGMWAPTLLITGVYNKLVKSLGPR